VSPEEFSFLYDGLKAPLNSASRGDMGLCLAEQRHFRVAGCTHRLHGKAKGDLFPSLLAVPNNRIRSPRVEPSSRWNNVDKGSRQNRRVTSGKALALRVGSLRPVRWTDLRPAAMDAASRLCSWKWVSTQTFPGSPQRWIATNLELSRSRGIQLFN
jgi:hypothetical protein